MSFKVVCFYQREDIQNRAVPGQTGLTEEQAQAYIAKIGREGSSRTCTSAGACARTRNRGAWFLGYTKE